ncbi:TatD family hydrolase [Neisseriaceae bacterium B1]
MFTDTHCHLTAPELFFRLPEIIQQAKEQGVNGFVVPSANAQDWTRVLDVSFRLPEIRAVALGIHPWFVDEPAQDDLRRLRELLVQNPRCWVGEIGLDFHPNRLLHILKDKQIEFFEQQLIIAREFQRPIIVHNVKATQAIVHSIQRVQFETGGIVHAFSGSLEEARLLIRLGFKIGLGSLLLNPNAKKVHHLAQRLPESSFVLETDSPYTLPENSNTPANIAHIAQIVAQHRACSLSELAQSCEKNLQALLAKNLA